MPQLSILSYFNFFYQKISLVEYNFNIFEFRIIPLSKLLNDIIFFLKYSSLFDFKVLSDLFGVDLKKYLEVYYYLLSFDYRLLLKNELDSTFISSINTIFLNSNWLERETWDMYGIFFKGNFDLRRILTDYGFDGFPLLKNFPLSGFFEFVYSNDLKKVSSKNIELTQQYRFFDFNNSWN